MQLQRREFDVPGTKRARQGSFFLISDDNRVRDEQWVGEGWHSLRRGRRRAAKNDTAKIGPQRIDWLQWLALEAASTKSGPESDLGGDWRRARPLLMLEADPIGAKWFAVGGTGHDGTVLLLESGSAGTRLRHY